MGGLLGEGGAKGVFPTPSKLLRGGGKGYVAPPPLPKLLGGGAAPAPLFLRPCVFRERLSVCVFASFSYGFEGGVWDLIFIPDHCLSIYFN